VNRAHWKATKSQFDKHNNQRVHLGKKKADFTALVFYFLKCYDVLSEHICYVWIMCSPELGGEIIMNFVEPIRDRKKIAQIKNLLRGQKRLRDLLLFVVGINTALRISDLLKLRIGHFLDENGLYKRRFWIKEQKRGKRHEVVINNSIHEALDEYLIALSIAD